MTLIPKKITLMVEGMTCGGCVEAVKRVIRKADEGCSVEVDLGSGRVEAVTKVPAGELALAVTKAGYDARVGE